MSDSTRVRSAHSVTRAAASRILARGVLLLASLFASVAHAGATWLVNNTGDPFGGTAANCAPANPGTCTLRDALAAAASGDTIHFALADNATIGLGNTLVPPVDMTIDGTGVANLTIDGNHGLRPFFIIGGVSVTLANLRIINGSAVGVLPDGAGADVFADSGSALTLQHCVVAGGSATSKGGGIYSAGSLTISDSTVADNSGGDQGGGIAASGSTTIDRSTVSGNHSNVDGGGILAYGANLHLSNSTVSGNSTPGQGGGVYAFDFPAFTNDTFYGNSAGLAGGAIYFAAATIGVTVTIADSTFVANTAGNITASGDIYYNLWGTWNFVNDLFTGGCKRGYVQDPNSLNVTGSFDTGTSCQFPAARSNAILELGPFGDHGGPTWTIVPNEASIAIDGGSCAVGTAVDQRGVARPQGAGCDAGAVEVERDVCYVKADADGANDGTSWDDAYVDLQSALAPAAGCGDVRVARGVYKPTAAADRSISFVISPGMQITGGYSGIAQQCDPGVWRSVLSGDIDGDDTGPNGIDADSTQIKGNNSFHVIVMNGGNAAGRIGATTILDGLTITGGQADATGLGISGNGGGMICADGGGTCSPTLRNLVFSGNFAAYGGGALFDLAGAIVAPTITQSTFVGNESADQGGAIFNNGQSGGSASPIIANVTFANNIAATFGGAVADSNVAGGATSTVVVNATFVGNSAGTGGSVLFENDQGGAIAAKLINVIAWGNAAPEVFSIDGVPGPTLDHVVIPGSCPTNASCTNLIAADPQLGALQDNGGTTPTAMPGTGSSAIDAGSDAACGAAPTGNIDQRGLPRPQGTQCDIGAVEATKLSLNVSDGSLFGFYGTSSLYVVTLQNTSATDAATGVRVRGLGTAALSGAGTSWFCTVGSCTTMQKSGTFDDTATLPPNSSLTWLVTVPVAANAGDATASLTIRSSGTGSDVDTDTLAIFRSTFE